MRGHSWEPVQPTLGQGVDDGALGGDLPNDWRGGWSGSGGRSDRFFFERPLTAVRRDLDRPLLERDLDLLLVLASRSRLLLRLLSRRLPLECLLERLGWLPGGLEGLEDEAPAFSTSTTPRCPPGRLLGGSSFTGWAAVSLGSTSSLGGAGGFTFGVVCKICWGSFLSPLGGGTVAVVPSSPLPGTRCTGPTTPEVDSRRCSSSRHSASSTLSLSPTQGTKVRWPPRSQSGGKCEGGSYRRSRDNCLRVPTSKSLKPELH